MPARALAMTAILVAYGSYGVAALDDVVLGVRSVDPGACPVSNSTRVTGKCNQRLPCTKPPLSIQPPHASSAFAFRTSIASTQSELRKAERLSRHQLSFTDNESASFATPTEPSSVSAEHRAPGQ